MIKTEFTALPGKQEVTASAVFDAPADFVFMTITDPKILPEWWGPEEMKTRIEKFELKTGGVYRYVQTGPDGRIFPFRGVYHEVSPARIVSTFEYEGMPGHASMSITKLEPIGGKTRLMMKTVFESVEDRDGMLEMDMRRGMVASMERLGKYIEEHKTEHAHRH